MNCKIFLIFLCLFAQHQLLAQNTYVSAYPDSNADLTIREISQESLDDMLEQEGLYYHEKPRSGESLTDRIKRWFYGLLEKLFDGDTIYSAAGTLVVILGIIGAVLILYFLQLGRKKTELGRSDVKWGEIHDNPVSIHTVQYDDWIEMAMREGNWNDVVKFLYLFTIKKLNDDNHLRYRPQYTNRQVLRRLKDGAVKHYFNEIAAQFEYIWYGHFDSDQQSCQSLLENFQNTFRKNKT